MVYKNCRKKRRIKTEASMKDLISIQDILQEKINQLKKIIGSEDVNEILKIDLGEINTESILLDTEKSIHSLKCIDFKKGKCKACIYESIKRSNYLNEKVQEGINKYNQYINTFKDILYLKNEKNIDDLVIRFGFDKNCDLICLVCDKMKYYNNDEKGNVYIVYGDVHKTKSEYKSCLKMEFKYKDDYIYIDRINASTDKLRCGHATFVFTKFNTLVQEMQFPKNVKCIKGYVNENKKYIKRNDLIKFYKKNGFFVYKDLAFEKNILNKI
ncbi:hypothetical protein [Tepidibacter hydrothermalis]|uniref:Uncharacterized protein n=1 Tax=Tepidibacter hydrothermalis TaxID=3036126 RepID=A0ABY8EJY8_9FIRM|nr:hypothetical protein [Tepidibacter hydrothermalis]WFD11430.1 hypothetical protein P4S50_04970 [Tepidibacter hydrothermalis]